MNEIDVLLINLPTTRRKMAMSYLRQQNNINGLRLLLLEKIYY